MWALQVAGACYLLQKPLRRWGPLALVPSGPVCAGRPPGKWGLDCPDVVSGQGLSDAEIRPVVPPSLQPVYVVWGIGPHVCHKAVATYHHWLGCCTVGGGECRPSWW